MTSNVEMSGELNGMSLAAAHSKGAQVREVFENTPRYLKSRRVDMMMRTEAVRTFAAGIERETMMDIGCGDGSISLPLLTRDTRLTLLDLSSNMLARAQASVPPALTGNVRFRNENFKGAVFEERAFDLIVTVGVMAHVDSPDAFLAKIHSILRPGGHLILEFTDAFHMVGRINRAFDWLKERIRPSKYATNLLSAKEVMHLLEQNNFAVIADFRYSRVPIPGIQRIFSADLLAWVVRRVFGSSTKNRNAWLGNEHICFVRSRD